MLSKSRVRVDRLKNRIYLVLEGYHDLAEALRIKGLYKNAIAECRSGFTVLVDVSEYQPGPSEVQEVHAEAVQLAASAGVAKVARVVGQVPLGAMQLDRIARQKATYPAEHFETVQAAEAFLDRD
ncbi:hypothetical protein ACFL27_15045 [candidate division CSSED10-310 bacterium]|uniref:STAS/SEC14 domain-containing protein n=1 Tax=candidate division CSSED10-310 bacterium TaxID=2855610 RepID=A0ABV6YZ86_UNCC1